MDIRNLFLYILYSYYSLSEIIIFQHFFKKKFSM